MREITPNDYRYQSREELLRYSSYVSGSNVLELPPLEEEVSTRKKNKKRRPKLHVVTKKEVKKEQVALYSKKEARKNGFSVMVAIAAIAMIGYSCVHYIQMGAVEDAYKDRINRLENQYVALKAENDLTEVNINSSVDYDKIMEVAVNELGMVFADRDQVVNYNSEKMEVVHQISRIPR